MRELEFLEKENYTPKELRLCYELAYAIDNGILFEKDSEIAYKFYAQIASQYPEALYQCAIHLLEGDGCKQLTENGLKLLKALAEGNNVHAIYYLGKIYAYGWYGIRADNKSAYRYFSRGRKLEDPYCAYYCASYLTEGRGIKKDYARAGEIFRRLQPHAATLCEKCIGLYYYLGLFYEEGLGGFEKNYTKAREMYEQGALRQDKRCFNQLGVFYSAGFGVQADLRIAASCFDKGAELGHTTAKSNLARCYEWGHGVEKNKDKAISLYIEAAKEGDDYSIPALKRLKVNTGVIETVLDGVRLFKNDMRKKAASLFDAA